ncbi:MAG: hypothetical protein LBT46_05015 [Planctomycetaceae bacterium]|nr:hypothetical protein [Planctomycetaceae bacterium]
MSNIFSRTLLFLIVTETAIAVLLLIIPVFFINHYNYEKKFFPTRELGIKCEQIWNSRYSTPCRYLSGDWHISGHAAWAMKDRPSVLFYWRLDNGGIENCNNKLITGTWASDADVNKNGGMILWDMDQYQENKIPDYILCRYPNAEILNETIILPYKTSAKVPPLRVGVAIVPPS